MFIENLTEILDTTDQFNQVPISSCSFGYLEDKLNNYTTVKSKVQAIYMTIKDFLLSDETYITLSNIPELHHDIEASTK